MGDSTKVTVVAASKDSGEAGAWTAALSGAGFAVRAPARTSDELIQASREPPDVVMISTSLEGWTKLTLELSSSLPILVMGDVDATDDMIAAVESGARGFLGTASDYAQIVEAVQTVANGGGVMASPLLGRLLRHLVRQRREREEALSSLTRLTPREREVFELAARGYDKRVIAEMLFISPETARTHLQRLLSKLDLHSRAELVAYAAKSGIDIEGAP